MNCEIKRQRIVIGEGKEHTVLKKPDSNIVLKTPKPIHMFLMFGRDRAETLRQELAEAQRLIENTEVKIPRTLIYSTHEFKIAGIRTSGYVIGQKFVKEDGSIEDIKAHLEKYNNSKLINIFNTEHQNFISNKGVLYWIDPTRGIVGRLLENMKIMKSSTYRSIRHKVFHALGVQK